MDKRAFIILIKKYLSGRSSPAEAEALERYFESFQQKDGDLPEDPQREARLLSRLEESIDPAGTSRRPGLAGMLMSWRTIGRLSAAAAAVLLVAAGLYFGTGLPGYPEEKGRQAGGPPETRLLSVATERGEHKKITLSDGTKVWLNTASRLQYPPAFAPGKREIVLEGEAYLEVAPDKTRPFTVRTTGMDVRVLGTSFNVRAYPGDPSFETALIEGAVEVYLDRLDRKITLKPNQKLVLANDRAFLENNEKEAGRPDTGKQETGTPDRLSVADEADLFDEIAWREHVFVFSDDSFEDIARTLERWYGYRIVFADRETGKKRFTATLSDRDDIGQIMEALKLSGGFDYKISRDSVRVTR